MVTCVCGGDMWEIIYLEDGYKVILIVLSQWAHLSWDDGRDMRETMYLVDG